MSFYPRGVARGFAQGVKAAAKLQLSSSIAVLAEFPPTSLDYPWATVCGSRGWPLCAAPFLAKRGSGSGRSHWNGVPRFMII